MPTPNHHVFSDGERNARKALRRFHAPALPAVGLFLIVALCALSISLTAVSQTPEPPAGPTGPVPEPIPEPEPITAPAPAPAPSPAPGPATSSSVETTTGAPAPKGEAEKAAKKTESRAVLPEYKGRYVGLFWLIILSITLVYWIAAWSLINQDTAIVFMDTSSWNSLIFLVGLAGLLLSLVVHAGFLFVTLLGITGLVTVYVTRRNAIVQENSKIFTKMHMLHLIRAVVLKFGIKMKEPEAQASGSSVHLNQETSIVVMRKDGQTLEAIQTDPRSPHAPSEAMTSINQILESAIRARATDIHIEPTQDALNIRFRVDGILHPLPPYPAHLGPPMVSVVKVLADMDIAEKRKPQDGSFAGKLDGRDIDFRVACSGTVHGQTMSIRILDRNRDVITLDKIGMVPKQKAIFQQLINEPHGMIIVSGPTGAGKTTTLYAALLEMDVYQKNIMTIEDPIEYMLDNIQQMSINPKQGITFAGSLRSILRQDPNVIMLGEIRDAETARIAMQAAMTGHLVLTTLHANESVVSIFRLLDLGVEPYLLAASVSCVLTQRLVRVLCGQCKSPYVPKPDFIKKVGLPTDKPIYFYKAVGCPACQGTGYYGRTGVFEMLVINDKIRDLLREKPSMRAIKDEGRSNNMRTLQQDGMSKVIQGLTSLKELIRVTK